MNTKILLNINIYCYYVFWNYNVYLSSGKIMILDLIILYQFKFSLSFVTQILRYELNPEQDISNEEGNLFSNINRSKN